MKILSLLRHIFRTVGIADFSLSWKLTVFSILSLLFFLDCSNASLAKSPPAVKGHLYLQDWDFSKGYAVLDGEWEFFRNVFFENSDELKKFTDSEKAKSPDFISVPSVWNSKADPSAQGEKIPVFGHAAYRLKVHTSKYSRPLGLRITDIGMAYSLYINNIFISSNGKPGRSREEMQSLLKYREIQIPSSETELDIVFLVSNYEYMESGIWSRIKLGHYDDLIKSQKTDTTVDFIVLGSLLIMGFYHLGLFMLRKKEKSPLFFGLFCLLVALRIISVESRSLLDWISFLSFYEVYRMDFFTFYAGVPVFALFLFHLFHAEFNTFILRTFLILSIPPALLPLTTPISVYPKVLIFVQTITLALAFFTVFILIKAIRRKSTGALIFLFGAVPFIVTIMNDILYANQAIHTFYMGSYGLLVFIFSQSIVLSRRFSKAFSLTEKLASELEAQRESLELSNRELQKLKENLEQIVSERVQELDASKREVEMLNEFSRAVNENLDIGEIMNTVMNYVTPNFGIHNYGLYLTDRNTETVKCLRASFPDHMSEEDRKYVLDTPIGLNARRAIHSRVFRTGTVVYFYRIPKSEVEAENKIAYLYQMRSFISVPLKMKNEVIGILDFFSMNTEMKIDESALNRLSVLADQVVGAVNNARLLKETDQAKQLAESEKMRSEKLLLNILPKDVAEELKDKGTAEPVSFDSVSVLFTDFQGFTKIAEKMSPNELIKELDGCFVQFDKITERFNLEKLKTIGDSYMCAGGIPKPSATHAIDAVLAALEIQSFMNQMKSLKEMMGFPYWELRLGIHTGPLVAGVIGEKKFAYDVWGDTVNTASRMESSGYPGRINISGTTYEYVKDFFDCEYRGRINAKNKGEVDMYFVLNLKKELRVSDDSPVSAGNEKFWKKYLALSL